MTRIISNYLRLALTFVFGLLIIRIMAEIGPDAALIFLVLASSTGIAAMFKFSLQSALVPALGLSMDNKGQFSFDRILWISFVASLGAGLISILLFLVFWLFSDKLNFGELTKFTVGVALLCTAVQSFVSCISVVFLNLVLVDRRIISYNVLLVLERLTALIPALIVVFLPTAFDVNSRIQIFYALYVGLNILLQLFVYFIAVRKNNKFILRRTPIEKDGLAWIGKLIGWNTVVVIAFAMFTRFPPLVVNWTMGESMTLMVGLVLTLIGYQRQLSMGLVVGLDALVARFYGGAIDGAAQAQRLVLRSTYILTVFSAFSVVLISLFVEPIFDVWLGDTLNKSGWDSELSASMFRIMSLGIAVSIISEGWMRFLSGKGDISSYAPSLVTAGFIHILVVVSATALLQEKQAITVLSISFSLCFVIANLGFIIRQTAEKMNSSVAVIYKIMALPAGLAVLAAIVGYYFMRGGWTFTQLVLTLIVITTLAGLAIAMMSRVIHASLNE